ncbi:MAG: leucyl aminopeptidase family protein [Pseudomonadota bacterium]
MLLPFDAHASATPIHLIEGEPHVCGDEGGELYERDLAWAKANGFEGKAGQVCTLPTEDGSIRAVLFGVDGSDLFALGALARRLPSETYRLANLPETVRHAELMVLGWCLGGYHFERYKSETKARPQLMCPQGVNFERVGRAAAATSIARDLINTPANDMSPATLETAMRDLAARYGADVSSIVGQDLLEQNFPMIHAVGRASDVAPRLVDMRWAKGNVSNDAPKITLVGKGVCFDTGGLDIKPSSAMGLMKKDMGGSACVLALAMMIMDAELDVRLRVLVPAVENSISAGAFRPGDILPSRNGMTVEIGNTDAEGRLVLADALTLAEEEEPELLIDMATLTGAARVAMGPDLPPFYSHDDALVEELAAAASEVNDPLWNLPLWPRYDKLLASKVADVNHISSGPFAGSITAALFLSRFVDKSRSWLHFDVYGWNPTERPQCRVGGEAQGVRALFELLEQRYGG